MYLQLQKLHCTVLYLPAGRLKTPAPTILLMRLKTSVGMVAVPPPCDLLASLAPPPRGISAAALAASFPRRVDDVAAGVLEINDDGIDCRVGVNSALVDAASRTREATTA